jgi:CRP/FNR family transcriptional regulator
MALRRGKPSVSLDDSERLASCELLGEFPSEARRELLTFSEPKSLAAGRRLFVEGEPCQALHLLLEGAVKMNKVSPEGKEQVVRLLRPGQIFGAAPLFTPEGVYPATAVALRPSRVLVVPKHPLIRLLKREPELMLKVLGYVSQHLQQMMHLAESVSLQSVPVRVAELLLREAARQGGPRVGQRLELGRSQTELAAELGTVREVLGRILQRWRKAGILELERGGIRLLNPEALRVAVESGNSGA